MASGIPLTGVAFATHEFAFGDAQAAYEAIDRGEDGLMHVALAYP